MGKVRSFYPREVPDWDRAMNAWLAPRVKRLGWSIINLEGAETPLSAQV